MLSPFQKEQLEALGFKSNHPKLIAHLLPRSDYVCHIVTLQQALELGLKI